MATIFLVMGCNLGVVLALAGFLHGVPFSHVFGIYAVTAMAALLVSVQRSLEMQAVRPPRRSPPR